MMLQSTKPNVLMFDLTKSGDVDSKKDDHMHSLTLAFDGKDQLSQHWTRFQDGKKKEVVELAFKRVK